MSDETPFNPLDKRHLGESVADALLRGPLLPLPPAEEFVGAGVYAIYCSGLCPAYQPIAERNRAVPGSVPIYVGKAIPAGARRGGFGLGASRGKSLFRRLREHAESIEQAENLALADFLCSHLVVDDIWIPLGESLVIAKFSPVWNRVIDGFGNHDPGGGRRLQQRSLWDVLHPGRPWAEKGAPSNLSEEAILKRLADRLAVQLPSDDHPH